MQFARLQSLSLLLPLCFLTSLSAQPPRVDSTLAKTTPEQLIGQYVRLQTYIKHHDAVSQLSKAHRQRYSQLLTQYRDRGVISYANFLHVLKYTEGHINPEIYADVRDKGRLQEAFEKIHDREIELAKKLRAARREDEKEEILGRAVLGDLLNHNVSPDLEQIQRLMFSN